MTHVEGSWRESLHRRCAIRAVAGFLTGGGEAPALRCGFPSSTCIAKGRVRAKIR